MLCVCTPPLEFNPRIGLEHINYLLTRKVVAVYDMTSIKLPYFIQ